MIGTETLETVSKREQTTPQTAPGSGATALLMAQHREVERIFGQIERAGERAFATKRKLLKGLSEKLAFHMKLEEDIFYPAAKKVADDAILEATDEHNKIKQLLRKLSGIERGDETFSAKIEALKELIEHHIMEEETELFPECDKLIAKEELAALAEKMAKLVKKKMDVRH